MKRTRKKHNGATSVFEGGNTAAEGTASEATTRGCRYRSEEDLGRLPVDCGLRYRQRPYCPRAPCATPIPGLCLLAGSRYSARSRRVW
jgi:hypothetical protein